MLSGLHDSTNHTMTENGAVARRTTNSAVLDLFSHGGALRGAPKRAVPLFDAAWGENPELALKTMFYLRDVRGGQGQRQAFRDQLKHLADISPETLRNNLNFIAEYGRWDDLYALMNTSLEGDVFELFKNQLTEDVKSTANGENISLLAKWLKSENASSKETKEFARKTRKSMGMDSKTYRKLLSTLREKIDVVERKTSRNRWNEIKYSHVPSNAMMKYRKAFRKHDELRFESFIGKVNAGESKMNMSVTYPYEIIEKTGVNPYISTESINAKEAQAMWDSLPNYVDGEPENAICVVDTSDSMMGTAMNVAISLGLYMSERASGPYKNHFITFSSRPQLQKIEGSDIVNKVRNMVGGGWDMNTDIEAVFNLILNVAVEGNLSQDEMVSKLYIISDMEFDGCGGSRVDETLMQTIQKRFQAAGYEMPFLVFWNVDACNKQQPMSMDDRGFQNVSGFSPSIFKALMENQNLDAYGLMLKVIDSERYSPLKV